MRIPLKDVFAAFLYVGVTAFGGGGNAHLYATLVQRRGWLTNHEYLEAIALCQLVPGPAFGVLATHLGTRLAGGWGGLVALAGLALPGASLMLALTLLYFGSGKATTTAFEGVLTGVAAVAVGLVLASLVRQAPAGLQSVKSILLMAGVFATYGLLHWPLLLVLALSVPVGLLLFWRQPPHVP